MAQEFVQSFWLYLISLIALLDMDRKGQQHCLVAADSIFCVKSSKSGRELDLEVSEALKQRFEISLTSNSRQHYDALFQTDLLQYLTQTLSEKHDFVWVISMLNDLMNNRDEVVDCRDGIIEAGRAYAKLLEGRKHVIVIGGRGDQWNIHDRRYETLAMQYVKDLRQLGLTVVWGGHFMEEWNKKLFTGYHWAGRTREKGAQLLMTPMCQVRDFALQCERKGPPVSSPAAASASSARCARLGLLFNSMFLALLA